jgi:hypothetical protein
MAEVNGSATTGNGRDANGKFLRGHRVLAGAGRPLGSRPKLAEAFLADLTKEWGVSGRKALKRCAQADPVQFCKLVGALLPRQVVGELVTLSATVDAKDLFAAARDYAQAFEIARQHIGAELPPMIECEVEPEEEATDAD